MKYISTRTRGDILSFNEVLLTGLARDGGLYVPEKWPTFSHEDILKLSSLSYENMAFKVMFPFVEGQIDEDDFRHILQRAYGRFRHHLVAPLRQINHNLWSLELYHGPTLAFKDHALQVLALLFDHFLKQRQEKITIVGATSGDTGSAAIEACRNCEYIELFILHPQGRISEIQRRQMTSVDCPNIHNISIDGDFDDCQKLVKSCFNDLTFRDQLKLTAVNSINWGRIMAQIPYYFWAATQLGCPHQQISFCVPTGNFGNVFAGYGAMKMGLPIRDLMVASNENDILTRFFETAHMTQKGLKKTLSPSMDIQVSSNFERLLFDAYDRNPCEIQALMKEFDENKTIHVQDNIHQRIGMIFKGARLDDTQTQNIMTSYFKKTGKIIDPHSAVAIGAAENHPNRNHLPIVCLETAHGAKFPNAVKEATGKHPPLPDHLKDLHDRKEKCTPLPNDLETLKKFILSSKK